MKNIVILGGSFDPIHKGHIDILNEAIKIGGFDEGWLLPARNPRWKKDCLSIKKRLKLLSLVCKNEYKFKVCKEEIYSKSTNYTYDTMLKLTQKYPDFNFSFLIGSDQLNQLHKWYKIDELINLVDFIVINRPNYELNIENITKYNCKLFNYCGPNISSTEFKKTLNLDLLPSYLHNEIIKEGDYYKRKLRTLIDYKRYCHSLEVAKLAKKIALSNKYDENKAFLAGLLHDCSKCISKSVELEIMNSEFKNYINESHFIYHQFTGSYFAKNEFNILDEEILEAIKWHTTGCVNMTTLSKIIYSADKIEPTRGYDSSHMINSCINDINSGFELVLKENYEFLLKKGFVVQNSELTKNCLKYYHII